MNMTTTRRPIWKILALAAENGARVPLTCDECFVILEFLADVAMGGAKEEYLLELVRRHLKRCPCCWEHHLEKLRFMEARLATWKEEA